MGYVFFYSAKNTEIYACAISEAKKNEKIINKIGKPIEPGFLVWTDSWGSGRFTERADFNTHLQGSKGSGTLYIRAFVDIESSFLSLIFDQGGKPEVVYQGVFPCNVDKKDEKGKDK